jgi:glycine/D-amino acid oxidase-like deaminating enzyme/nitrite reductase/ring-hydroxylating ferredoxin subunit
MNKKIISGHQQSLWLTGPKKKYSKIIDVKKVDTVIVGGGIMGITVAALLKDIGQKVAVIESGSICNNVTGHTTAKITVLHGLIYTELFKIFSRDEVKTFAQLSQRAIGQIEKVMVDKHIDCDFLRTPGFTYTEKDENINKIEGEVSALIQAGLKAELVKDTPLPFNIKASVKLNNQAQFHPYKYIIYLADDLVKSGNYVFEKTRALDIEEKKGEVILRTDNGDIKGNNLIIATQFPFWDKGFFFSKIFPHYAYALAYKLKGVLPKGIYFCEDDEHHSIRNQMPDTLIVGGGHHKSGQGGDTLKQYENIKHYAEARFNVESLNYFWSTMDYDTADGIPYVGMSPGSNNIYLATGFGGWGMTNSMLSANILADMIIGKKIPWQELFSPSRKIPRRKKIVENLNVTKQIIKGKIVHQEPKKPSELEKGEAKVFHKGVNRIAVYKDAEGKIHQFSPNCTHMGCTLSWNNAELTWDCPCHGSRFNFEGEVIHGPALRNLKKIKNI